MGCHFLLQGIFPTQGSNPSLLHCRWLYHWVIRHHFIVGNREENSASAQRILHPPMVIPIPKKGNPKECSNYRTIALISYTSKVMLKILQARLQQYVNRELPDVQAGFRKGRGTRDQIANICWIIEKVREFQKKHLFLLYWLCQSLWLCRSQQTVENSERDGNTRPPDLPLEKPVYRSGSNS